MLSKTHLIHIRELQPVTLQEAINLTAAIEYMVAYHIKRSILNNAYTVSGIYVNRKDVYSVPEHPVTVPAHLDGEFYQLSHAVDQFVSGLVDAFYLTKVRKPNLSVNIECGLSNRSTISLSFDVYSL